MDGERPEADELQSPPEEVSQPVPKSEGTPVPLDRIRTAPLEIPGPTGDAAAQKEKTFLAAESEKFTKELGWLGRTFGGRREKPGNISALVICLIFAFLFIGFAVETATHIWYPVTGQSSLPFDKLFSGLTSIITLILGYLFGSNEKSDK